VQLGRGVAQRVHQAIVVLPARRHARLQEAEVTHQRAPLAVDDDTFGRQTEVQDPAREQIGARVRMAERLGHVDGRQQRRVERQRPVAEDGAQRRAPYPIRDEIIGVALGRQLVSASDVRMRQSGPGIGGAHQSPERGVVADQLLRHQQQREVLLEARVSVHPGPVHGPHRSARHAIGADEAPERFALDHSAKAVAR
jgi:hypothetical protein